jgi:hypothetical protein
MCEIKASDAELFGAFRGNPNVKKGFQLDRMLNRLRTEQVFGKYMIVATLSNKERPIGKAVKKRGDPIDLDTSHQQGQLYLLQFCEAPRAVAQHRKGQVDSPFRLARTLQRALRDQLALAAASRKSSHPPQGRLDFSREIASDRPLNTSANLKWRHVLGRTGCIQS